MSNCPVPVLSSITYHLPPGANQIASWGLWCSETICLSNGKLLQAKGLCFRRLRRYRSGGSSEQGRQASITVDMCRFSVWASFRQLREPRRAGRRAWGVPAALP